jgi:hypothetical protein
MGKSVKLRSLSNEDIGNEYYLSATWKNVFRPKKNFKRGKYHLLQVNVERGCLFTSKNSSVTLYPEDNGYVNIRKIKS